MTEHNHDVDLILRHIEADPWHPGPGDVRLVDSGVSVWAIIGYLGAVDGDLDRAAADYDISPEAARAAFAYYQRYKGAIDDRLTANSGGFVISHESIA